MQPLHFLWPEPLAPEIYSYWFVVDGLRINDPSNVFMIRDVSGLWKEKNRD